MNSSGDIVEKRMCINVLPLLKGISLIFYIREKLYGKVLLIFDIMSDLSFTGDNLGPLCILHYTCFFSMEYLAETITPKVLFVVIFIFFSS